MLVLVLELPLVACAATQIPEQTITAIPSGTEQRVEPVTGPDEQQVQVIDPNAPQSVSKPGTTGPIGRVAGTVGKVAVGVLAAGISLGAMAATLLFF